MYLNLNSHCFNIFIITWDFSLILSLEILCFKFFLRKFFKRTCWKAITLDPWFWGNLLDFYDFSKQCTLPIPFFPTNIVKIFLFGSINSGIMEVTLILLILLYHFIWYINTLNLIIRYSTKNYYIYFKIIKKLDMVYI